MASNIMISSRMVARGLRFSSRTTLSQQITPSRRVFTTTRARHVEGMKPINSTNLLAPIGPYSHAMKTPFAIYCSGQLPAHPDGSLVSGTIGDRTRACLMNLKEVLASADSSLAKIVKVQIFLTDMNDFAAMNKEYEKWIQHAPARSCVAVKQLPKGVDIEIECIAIP